MLTPKAPRDWYGCGQHPTLAEALGRGEPHASVLRQFIKFNELPERFLASLTNHKRLSNFNKNFY